jgi:ATP-dependent Clp protease ATP-binding subunit ClpC
VYERYTESARRAVFFAVWHSRLREAKKIDTVDLLRGLMHDDNSRVNTVFGLSEQFPFRCGCPSKFVTPDQVPEFDPVLTKEVKRILAWTAREADDIRDYWIDSEHLVLGTLRESRCMAAQFLARAGLTLEKARRTLIQNKDSRPDYGPVPQLWAVQSPLERFLFKWRMRKYRRGN